MITAENILNEANYFEVTTMKNDGFPLVHPLTSIMNRFGIVTLCLYMSKDSETIQNILRNQRGSIVCHARTHQDRPTILKLDGLFSVVEISEVGNLSSKYKEHDEKYRYENPCILIFETLKFDAEVIN